MHNLLIERAIQSAHEALAEARFWIGQAPEQLGKQVTRRQVEAALAMVDTALRSNPDALRGDLSAARSRLRRDRFPPLEAVSLSAALAELAYRLEDVDQAAAAAAYPQSAILLPFPDQHLLPRSLVSEEMDELVSRLSHMEAKLDFLANSNSGGSIEFLEQDELIEYVSRNAGPKIEMAGELSRESQVDILGISNVLTSITELIYAFQETVSSVFAVVTDTVRFGAKELYKSGQSAVRVCATLVRAVLTHQKAGRIFPIDKDIERRESILSTPLAASSSVQIGDILNDQFEIRRLIVNAPMGKVFEGVNMLSNERVAIKLFSPIFSEDSSFETLFRTEARMLSRISHPALVRYQLLARDPQLNVLYHVTDYIEGPSLDEILPTVQLMPDSFRALAYRLASGLRAAHETGVVHCDLTPANILLEGGQLEQARIIDFGAARDFNPSAKTIVGNEFHGTLGYAAPELFGLYGREVGPWTDVYSLGLVLLAAVQGRHSNMGSTPVEAVESRRLGPDLSLVEPEIRRVLQQMLIADPDKRIRSMDQVLRLLRPSH